MRRAILAAATLVCAAGGAAQARELLIPRSAPGDEGRYCVLEATRARR